MLKSEIKSKETPQINQALKVLENPEKQEDLKKYNDISYCRDFLNYIFCKPSAILLKRKEIKNKYYQALSINTIFEKIFVLEKIEKIISDNSLSNSINESSSFKEISKLNLIELAFKVNNEKIIGNKVSSVFTI